MPSNISDEQLAEKRAKQYEKQREKQYASQQRQMQRQREKQQARLNDNNYLEAQKEKQRLSAERQAKRQFEKQQAKLNCAKTQAKQQEKAIKAQEKAQASAWRSQLKQQEKQKALRQDADYQAKEHAKRLQQQAAQQKKSIKKQLEKLSQEKSSAHNKDNTALKPKRKAIKSRGLKGRTPNVQERYLANKLGSLGCICCRNQGWYTEAMNNQEGQAFISMHHVEGRVKPWAHAKQLPLCHFHHQVEPPSDAPVELFPIHGNSKKAWEKVNGTQEALLKQVYEMINETRPWLESSAGNESPTDTKKSTQESD